MKLFLVFAVLALCAHQSTLNAQPKGVGVRKIRYRGYTECYRVFNKNTEVIIVAQAGGRILSYKNRGYEIMYENSATNGKTIADTQPRWEPDGGRFDIGPENAIAQKLKVPRREQMWRGNWNARIVGPRALQLESAVEPDLGLRVTRLFRLDENSPRLEVRQTMTNVSDKPTAWNFWSRTLLKSGGICVQPIQKSQLLPQGWAKYLAQIETQNPQDDRVQVQDDFLIVAAGGRPAKFGTDAPAQWMAYVRDDWMFIKRFRYFPNGTYTDGLGFSTAIYIDYPACEVEPLSPQANLQPGQSYTFTEWWWLLPYPHEKPIITGFNAKSVEDFVAQNTALPE